MRDVMAEELPHLVLASDSGPGPWKSSPPPAPSDTDTTTIGENSKNTEIKQSKEKEKEKDKDVVRFDYLAAFDYFLCRKAHNESIPSHLLERDLQCDEVVERHMVARFVIDYVLCLEAFISVISIVVMLHCYWCIRKP